VGEGTGGLENRGKEFWEGKMGGFKRRNFKREQWVVWEVGGKRF